MRRVGLAPLLASAAMAVTFSISLYGTRAWGFGPGIVAGWMLAGLFLVGHNYPRGRTRRCLRVLSYGIPLAVAVVLTLADKSVGAAGPSPFWRTLGFSRPSRWGEVSFIGTTPSLAWAVVGWGELSFMGVTPGLAWAVVGTIIFLDLIVFFGNLSWFPSLPTRSDVLRLEDEVVRLRQQIEDRD